MHPTTSPQRERSWSHCLWGPQPVTRTCWRVNFSAQTALSIVMTRGRSHSPWSANVLSMRHLVAMEPGAKLFLSKIPCHYPIWWLSRDGDCLFPNPHSSAPHYTLWSDIAVWASLLSPAPRLLPCFPCTPFESGVHWDWLAYQNHRYVTPQNAGEQEFPKL